MMRMRVLAAGLSLCLLTGRGASADDASRLAAAIERGDIAGAVAAYRGRHDPWSEAGMSALRRVAIEVLRIGLNGEDVYERNVVAGILGKRGDPAALWILNDALHSTDALERRTAADALADIATPGAVGALRRLYDEGPNQAPLALSALVRTGDRTALMFYLDAITSPDPGLRAAGAGGLGVLRVRTARGVLRSVLAREADPLVCSDVAWALALLGDSQGLVYLKKQIRDESEQVRDVVAGLLGSIARPEVAPLLRAALRDESENVRVTAAASLTRFKDGSGLPWVEEALEHPDFRVRLGAAASFLRMDYPTARWLIVKALRSGDPLVRANALKAVGENRDGEACGLVAETVERERDRYVRAQGAWTLGQLGGAEQVPLLVGLLAGERAEVRHASAEAVLTIADRLLRARHGASL